MAPFAAVKPNTRNLLLWLFVAAPLFYLFSVGFSSWPAPEPQTSAYQAMGHREKNVTAAGLRLLARAPAVVPGLVTQEIILPRKILAPPTLLATPLDTRAEPGPTTPRKSRRPLVKPVNRHLRHLIHAAAIRHGIDPAMIHAIIMAESSFNPDAVSNRGAQGLMQLMPQTAESLGLADAFDPGKNIDAGARYFRQLLNQFRGDVELALAAYNAGIQSVINHNGVPPFKTTQRYVRKVLDYYEHYRRMLTG